MEKPNIIGGTSGFSYELKSLQRRYIAQIRDAQDELFAIVEYTPQTEEYCVEIDGGYTTREDLETSGLLDQLDLRRAETPKFENMLGNFPSEQIDNWEEIVYGILEENGRLMEVENIDSSNKKTLIRLTSPENPSSTAETLVNTFNPPNITGEHNDPYRETWKPHSNSVNVKQPSKNRQKTVEEVFNTAITLTEDLLEQKQRK